MEVFVWTLQCFKGASAVQKVPQPCRGSGEARPSCRNPATPATPAVGKEGGVVSLLLPLSRRRLAAGTSVKGHTALRFFLFVPLLPRGSAPHAIFCYLCYLLLFFL